MLQWTTIQQPAYNVSLYIPDATRVQETFAQQKAADAAAPLPYWAKLWPAALAMGSFITEHPEYVQGKHVLELAAGLGLPSLVAAPLAGRVVCSDYLPEAVDTLALSVQRNQFSNVDCQLLNWHYLPENLTADTLIMSDINYDTAEFEQLYIVLEKFIQAGTTILLSTPQRLMGKPFIERISQWVTVCAETAVTHQSATTFISVFALKMKY
ncbi:class I SAM-dependent methyltransferase [Deminuibacter soli]|uniref:Methyltransferase domain-containing protein n=1 Tax=Deminuibacter soli TaxID=2291815 RepID=A0A3E1NQR1_9BACT|nr:hypothetical protein [Deminuibacter soli]RFM30128.1 hypothetical protein DXN05_03905 [Deminuibacter soli]